MGSRPSVVSSRRAKSVMVSKAHTTNSAIDKQISKRSIEKTRFNDRLTRKLVHIHDKGPPRVQSA